MKIHILPFQENEKIIIVGSNGLIGNAIQMALSPAPLETDIKASFFDIERSGIVAGIKHAILSCLNEKANSTNIPITVIYACGKGGFGISREVAKEQTEKVRQLINEIQELKQCKPRLIYISSLGAHLSKVNTNYKLMIDANEKLVTKFSGSLIIRLPGIWGFKKPHKLPCPSGIIAHLLLSARTGKEANIYGDLSTTRPYLSASNTGKSIISLASKCHPLASRAIINLYSPFQYSIADIASTIKKSTSKRILYRLVAGQKVDRESHLLQALNGTTVTVLESFQTELKLAWMKL